MAKKILYIQTAFLGDVCLSVPVLQALKRQYPESKIFVVVRDGLGSFLEALKVCDVAYEVKKGQRSSYNKIVSTLKSENIDLLLCPHSSIRSLLFSRLIPAQRKIGFNSFWSKLVFDRVENRDQTLPESVRQLLLVQEILPEVKKALGQFNWSLYKSQQNQKEDFYQLPELPKVASLTPIGPPRPKIKAIGLFPGSVWGTKKLPKEKFLQIAEVALSRGYEVRLYGSKSEKPETDFIEQSLVKKGFDVTSLRNLAGTLSLSELVYDLAELQKVFANDSGGQHLAALAGVPTVTFFGPTVPSFGYRSLSPQAFVSQMASLDCRPCHHHGPKVCPLKHHKCLRELNMDPALATISRGE